MSHHNLLFSGRIYPGGAGLGAGVGKPGKSGAPKIIYIYADFYLENLLFLKLNRWLFTPTPFSVYVFCMSLFVTGYGASALGGQRYQPGRTTCSCVFLQAIGGDIRVFSH